MLNETWDYDYYSKLTSAVDDRCSDGYLVKDGCLGALSFPLKYIEEVKEYVEACEAALRTQQSPGAQSSVDRSPILGGQGMEKLEVTPEVGLDSQSGEVARKKQNDERQTTAPSSEKLATPVALPSRPKQPMLEEASRPLKGEALERSSEVLKNTSRSKGKASTRAVCVSTTSDDDSSSEEIEVSRRRTAHLSSSSSLSSPGVAAASRVTPGGGGGERPPTKTRSGRNIKRPTAFEGMVDTVEHVPPR